MQDPAKYVKDILIRPTERDKQRKIGASQISNACTRCLAEDIAGYSKEQGPYNLGAIVGTAIHEYLEHRNLDTTAQREMRVILGDIEGYGTVRSTTDLYLPEEKLILDLKTTTRDKLARYQYVLEYEPQTPVQKTAKATMAQYFRQTQLYAMGVTNAGFEVDYVGIVFVCRDGQMVDRDIWSPPLQYYDPEAAHAYFDRARRIWEYVDAGERLEKLTSAEGCYYCEQVRPFVIGEVEL